MSKVPYTPLAVNAQAIPPAAAAKHVVTRVRDVNAGSADNTEPPLNPNHPNQRIKTPAAERGKFEPGIAIGFPSLSNFPYLAPKKYMMIKAPHPPTE